MPSAWTLAVYLTVRERGQPAVRQGGPWAKEEIMMRVWDLLLKRSQPLLHIPASCCSAHRGWIGTRRVGCCLPSGLRRPDRVPCLERANSG